MIGGRADRTGLGLLLLAIAGCSAPVNAAAGPGALDASSDAPGAGNRGSAGAPASGGATGTTALGGRASAGGTVGTDGSSAGGSGASTGGGVASGGGTAIDSGLPPAAAAVRIVGRTDGSASAPRFEWSGVSVQARFQGTTVSADLDGGDQNYFEVVVDGTVLSQVATSAGRRIVALASGLTNAPHDLVLFRKTEANNGAPTTFYGLDLGGGTLLPVAAPPHRLEVIGDSITCGYGDEAPNPCKFSYDTENAYTAYGSVAGRELHADIYTECWSGKGVLRNYDGSTSDPFPTVYPLTIPTESGSRWDFSYSPEAVVVNLGTNDFTKGDPGGGFADAYQAFVTMLRSQHPRAFIFVVIGPMLSGPSLTQARGYLDAVVKARIAAGDRRIAQILVDPQVPANGLGCDSHPSEKTHALIGKALAQQIRSTLGW